VLDVYLYLGKVSLGPLSGYLWLLGRRLHTSVASRRYLLGNLLGSTAVAARLRRLTFGSP